MISAFPRIQFLVVILFVFTSSVAQERKTFTVEDIWAKGTLWPQSIPGFNWYDDNSYTSLVGSKILRYSAVNGEILETLFENKEEIEIDDYTFSDDRKKLLLSSEAERIYRHSTKAIYHIVDLATRKVNKLSDKKISYPTFSPDFTKVAYVVDNDLYYAKLEDLKPIAITSDGKFNSIINGSTDWVYEEEFSITRVFFWSSDSKKIAFLKFNESEVKEYNMQVWNDLYPEDYRYKYPKAGEKNSTVTVHCYFLDGNKTKDLAVANEKDYYIPRLQWTKNPDLLSVQVLNRHQNYFQLLHSNVASGENKVVYEEKNDTYVDITDDLNYLNDGKFFILTSEKDGFRHIYKYDMSGKLAAQITKGNWEVTTLSGVDEKSELVYFTSTEVSPLERHLYSSSLDGKKKKKLTASTGTHEVEFSPAFKYYIDTYSAINQPPRYSMHLASSGKEVKLLQDNARLTALMDNYKMSRAEFFDFTTSDNVKLKGYTIKPTDMDPQKKYPVLLFVYGGPGYQSATDAWQGPNYFWFQLLAQKGYMVVCIDNRGTGGRGAEFKKITQHVLGKYETQDVVETARYLKTLPNVDGQRIGIFGWSFGGYLSSLAITLGADHFKAAIAVAPVTSWRFYDTIYTERFLGLPQENPEGYDQYSPLSHAALMRGNYLLIHGTADDNVHVQNALEMQKALIRANKQFEVFYYPDKNHGIYGGNTRLHLYNLMTDFILRKL